MPKEGTMDGEAAVDVAELAMLTPNENPGVDLA